jgi:ketosteroid isomerase-like protein
LFGSLLLLAGACRKHEAPAPKPSASTPPPPAASAPPPPSSESLARRYLACSESFNRSAYEELLPCYGANAVSRWLDSGLADEKGPSAIVDNRKKALKTAFPDVKLVPQVVLVDGLNLASMGVLSGTHTGPLMAKEGLLDATKKPIGELVFSSVGFDPSGLIAAEALLMDRASMLFQLGVRKQQARPRSTQGRVDAPYVVVAKNDASERANIDVVARHWHAFSDENLPAVAATLADDVVLAEQTAEADARGKAAALKAIDATFRAFSGIMVDCPSRWAAGPYVVSGCVVFLTHDGELHGLKATGRTARVHMAEVVRLDGGLEKEIFRFADGAKLASELEGSPGGATTGTPP